MGFTVPFKPSRATIPRFHDSTSSSARSPCTQTPVQCLTQGPTGQMNSGQRGEHQREGSSEKRGFVLFRY